MAKKTTKERKKIKKTFLKGIVHIKNTFNNTTVTVTDPAGNVFAWANAGSMNFKGARKSTPYASEVAAASAMESALKFGLKEVDIRVNGPGYGRESAIRAVVRSGVNINMIKDVTGLPHNGCRARKLRRN